jgi:hypothetical protein
MWSALTAGAAPSASDPHELPELRTWARRAWWADRVTPRQKAAAILELASAPWRFVKEARRVFRKYGRLVARDYGIPPRRQVIGLIAARARHGLDPIAYYRFQLFRPERWKQADRYVQTADTGRILRWLVASTPGYGSVFGDKRAFEAWCVEQRLPTIRTLMEFQGGRMVRALAADGSLPAIDLFSKPSNWQAGCGTERWTYRDGHYVGSDGRPRTTAELAAELARLSAEIDRPILLQPTLRNAEHDAPLTPGALCTARITTVRMPGGEPRIWFAVYRMPADGSSRVDNFGSGGLASTIDVATGRLGPAVRKYDDALGARAERHPHTGAPIAGHQLAHWPEAVALALRAHRVIAWNGVPVIGWDVALLEDGPVLVEGNNVPCSTFAQMVLEQPLGDAPLVACINAHLRECFGSSPARG